MSLVLACSVYYCTLFETAKPGGTIVMITLAAYTFYRVTTATVHAVKVRKHDTALLTTIRNIDFADAAVSLLSLQRAMLISFEGKTAGEIGVMNLATGIAVCLLIMMLGLTMLFQKKNIRNKETDLIGKIQIGKGK